MPSKLVKDSDIKLVSPGMGKHGETSYPLVNKRLLLKMAIEIVELPIKNGYFP
jgi:hypothetical protein